MGKPTGFLEYERKNNPALSVEERIKGFNEFHTTLSIEDRRQQAARCMNCGAPFCQSAMIINNRRTGCPLSNLIPEWNDELYHGNWNTALTRLLKTSSFPEFTSRVCPALCECACTCGHNDKPISIKQNEYSIIEYGFSNNLIQPRTPKVRSDKKVAVIGSGPSGLACGDMLNRRGHNVTIFERDDKIGGLLMYGIPNMKLEKHIITRRENLMLKEGVNFLTSQNINTTKKAQAIINEYDAVIIACGSKKARDPFNGEKHPNGVYFAVDYLTMQTKNLLDNKQSFVSAKDKNVIILGGGDTGNDCVGTAIRQGCKSILQVEIGNMPPLTRQENNPWPEYPNVLKTDYGQEEAISVFGKDPRLFNLSAKDFVLDENGTLKSVGFAKTQFVNVDGRVTLKELEEPLQYFDCDLLLIAAGFVGLEDYTAKAFNLTMNKRGCIETNGFFQTSNEKVFACGDNRTGQSLVVTAINDGRNCAKEVDKFLMHYTNLI